MSKFILVHDATTTNASPIIINVNNILFVTCSEKYNGASQIELNDLDADASAGIFHVTETREQIFEMLK